VQINVALFVGSAVPLLCYLLWLVVSLGASGTSGGGFVDPVKQVMQGRGLSATVVQLWALLAVVTSFIGCGMAQVCPTTANDGGPFTSLGPTGASVVVMSTDGANSRTNLICHLATGVQADSPRLAADRQIACSDHRPQGGGCSEPDGDTRAQAEYEASLMRQWMAPVWTKLKDGGGKLKAAWDNGGLDLLSYGVVLLPPLVISLVITLPPPTTLQVCMEGYSHPHVRCGRTEGGPRATHVFQPVFAMGDFSEPTSLDRKGALNGHVSIMWV